MVLAPPIFRLSKDYRLLVFAEYFLLAFLLLFIIDLHLKNIFLISHDETSKIFLRI